MKDRQIIKRVDVYLKRYKRLYMIAYGEIQQKMTQEFSYTNARSNVVSSSIENSVIEKVKAQEEIDSIKETLSELSEENRKILTDKYLIGLSMTKSYGALNMSKSSYYRHLDEARLEFYFLYTGKGYGGLYNL